ncbi:MAG: isoprenyl transferase [Bacteroidaceae bacterium]|nr:isoprenyl transferase [Bacteroidaceae bacterium]
MQTMQQLDINKIPEHIAIIMDGNGRWAQAKGLPRTAGHIEGVETVKKVTEEAARLGVKYLTLYTFSTENWNRPAEEIEALMNLVLTNLEEEIFMQNNVRFRMIGEMERLPQSVQKRLQDCIDRTSSNSGMTMVIALSYSSRWEIVRATQTLATKVKDGILPIEDITEEVITQHLTTDFMPDPDLLIRTGGELRISNYLLWQCAYSEFYFTNQYWPDFNEESLKNAIADYQLRQRRYGKTGEQVSDEE